MKRRQMLKLGLFSAGAAALAVLPKTVQAQSSCPPTPTDPHAVFNVVTFGARGNGSSNDLDAIQCAVNAAKASCHGLATVYFPPGRYVIDSQNGSGPSKSINIDYSSMQAPIERRGIKFKGDHASILLKGPLTWAFGIDLPQHDNNESFFIFEDLWFYGLTTGGALNAIRGNYASYVTIRNCAFFRVAKALEFSNATNIRVISCDFFHTYIGVEFFHCRDSLISDCYSYGAKQAGFFLRGTHDTAPDGASRIEQCVALGATHLETGPTAYGIRVQGVYAPILSDIIVEHNNVNLLVESCQFGNLSNMFSGPADGSNAKSIHFLEKPEIEKANIAWNISNVNVQNEVIFERLQQSRIDGLVSWNCTSSTNDAAISFKLCADVEINATVKHITPANFLNDLRVFKSSEGIRINGGFYHQRIKLDDERSGNNLINSPHTLDDILFEGGVKEAETGVYFVKHGLDKGTEKHIANGFVLPSLQFDGTIPPLGESKFKPLNVLPDPGAGYLSIARFACMGGHAGSYSGAEISVIRTSSQIHCDIVNTIGRISSFYVEIGSEHDPEDHFRLRNSSASFGSPFRVALIDYKVVTV